MRIQDYEYEEEKMLSAVADLFQNVADQIREGGDLKLPMPSVTDGHIMVPVGEPVETEIEVSIRKHFVHLKFNLAWTKEDILED